MRTIVTIILALLTINMFGQGASDFEYMHGDLSFLKNEKIINVEFSWDSMAVGEFNTEAEYIAKKVAEHNAASPGKGDAWLKEWESNKTMFFEPAFVEGLNDKFKKTKQLQFEQNNKEANYTMFVHTTFIESGNKGDPVMGFGSVVAEIIMEVQFLNRRDNNAVAVDLKIHAAEVVLDYSYTSQSTLHRSYLQTGKRFSKYLIKEVLN